MSRRAKIILMIPPMNLPIMYLILNQCIVWRRLQIPLGASYPLILCFPVGCTVHHTSFSLLQGPSIPIWCQISPNQIKLSRVWFIATMFPFFCWDLPAVRSSMT